MVFLLIHELLLQTGTLNQFVFITIIYVYNAYMINGNCLPYIPEYYPMSCNWFWCMKKYGVIAVIVYPQVMLILSVISVTNIDFCKGQSCLGIIITV